MSNQYISQTYTRYINIDSSKRNINSTYIYETTIYYLPPYPIEFINGST